MSAKNMFIFYVSNIAKSIEFYQQILEMKPVEQSEGFAMFPLSSGALLGLWLAPDVKPEITSSGTESELIFSYPEQEIVDNYYQTFLSKKIPVMQKPALMDFGYSFVISDPDGHRIRYFSYVMGCK